MTTAGLNQSPDAELVAASLRGDLHAFQDIVERNQSAVYGVAYAVTGNAAASEDVAQETFLAAWRQLPSLREPEKLRAWLCGISRTLSKNSLRRSFADPLKATVPLDGLEERAADAPSPRELAEKEERSKVIWEALKEIPELYREPVVMFYQEEQSIAAVASALNLTEDTVKQRLSRGRKMLRERLDSWFEESISAKQLPKGFAAATIAAIALMPPREAAAGAIVTTVKTGIASKSGVSGIAAAGMIVPILGFATGFMCLRQWLRTPQSERERRFVKRWAWISGVFVGGFHVMAASLTLGWHYLPPGAPLYESSPYLLAAMWLLYIAILAIGHSRVMDEQNRIRKEESADAQDADPR